VSTPLKRFAFIDAVHAAELLRVSPETVLDWVSAGKLKAYGGKPSNPFLRSADVAALVEEMGIEDDVQPRRTKSASAKVQARLTADARWGDVTEDDINEWVSRADPVRRQAARTAAATARDRLDAVLRALESV
jgi:hypothetical protein